MKIYIEEKDMPETCFDCPFMLHRSFCLVNTKIKFTDEEYSELKGRYIGCPLIPVPPHGDLIDRDGIKWFEEEFEERCHNDRWTVVEKIAYKAQVDKLPTIIQADESNMDSFIHIFEEDDEEDGMDSFIRILKE